MQETLLLFIQRNIQEDLDDAVAVFIKIAFIIADLAVSLLEEIRIINDSFCHMISLVDFMHFHDQDIFIIGAVEHRDFSADRKAAVDPP